MAQRILLFEMEKEKMDKIQEISARLRIQIKQIAPKDYAQQLGYLAGIKGFNRQNNQYSGAPFPMEMLVFSGMDSEQVDLFLEEYKKTGMKPIGLKAIITEHNVFWTPQALFGEILREHKAFHA